MVDLNRRRRMEQNLKERWTHFVAPLEMEPAGDDLWGNMKSSIQCASIPAIY